MGFEKENHWIEAVRNFSVEKAISLYSQKHIYNKASGTFGNKRLGSYFDQYLPSDT